MFDSYDSSGGVLVVGVAEEKMDWISELPVTVLFANTGKKAVEYLKKYNISIAAGKWDLKDMPDGVFLARLKKARPYIPTVALVETGNRKQEIAARSLGISAVISDDAGGNEIKDTLAGLLVGIEARQPREEKISR